MEKLPPRKNGEPISLNAEHIRWLDECHQNRVDHKIMAKELGVHPDTIKRLMDRYGITDAGYKKIEAKDKPKTWTRPCMKCKCVKPRPVNQYVCKKCKLSTTLYSDDYLFT